MKSPPSAQEFLDALFRIRDVGGQSAFISRTDYPVSDKLIEELSARIREWLPKDRQLAEALAESNLLLASRLDTPLGWAFANQCRAYVFMNMKQCAEAQPFYERAAALFEEAGADRELGRTLSAEAENLTYLGEYARARDLAERSRALLEAAGDTRYLPRVHVMLGNLFNRTNRYTESLAEYDRALRVLETSEDNSEDYIVIAAVELNRAGTLTELNRFDEAIQSFERARDFCTRHQIALWADILDRNIADLYFKRGSYSDALRSLEKVRPRYREQEDQRRLALCDLARAEIYLQLNLSQEAGELAEGAEKIFEAHSNRLEAAQCRVLVGIAQSERGEKAVAERSFGEALGMFREEGNTVSAAAVDLQLAKLHHKNGNFQSAERLARAAAEAFNQGQLAVRGAYARITLAHALREQGRGDEALAESERALQALSGYHAKWVSYQCYDLLATLQAGRGNLEEAERLYVKAIEEMESLRGNIQLDEFRMSFGRDKYQVYENLVDLKLRFGAHLEAFEFVERSKSRTLIDLLERNTGTLWEASESGLHEAAIAKLRRDLNGLYSRLSQAGTTVSGRASDKAIQEEITRREQEMMALVREAGSERAGWVALQSLSTPSVEQIQRVLSEDEALIEFYAIGDRFAAFVVGRSSFHVATELARADQVRASLKGLNFQLSKFHLSAPYLAEHRNSLLEATRHHLHQLYLMLLAPLEKWIRGRSLVIVPHQILHYVPFQALWDGSEYVVDRHDVVSSASASVLKICRARTAPETQEDLVLAVPDESTPAIRDEAQMLGEILPRARVLVGEDAKVDLLRKYGPRAGKIHIAAHGVFRSDNPMFSSLKLADSWLSLVDVFNLKLGAELTTLSACETGMSALDAGDELLGLARGFLYAGTPSLVVSLWRVNDRSTTELMRCFYRGLVEGLNKPKALQRAAIEVKKQFPHPYFWAPFVVMGKS